MSLPKIIKDCLTGPDGETYAIGRIFAVPTLIAGLAVPFVALAKGQAIDFTGLSVLFGGLGAAVMAMIGGTNFTEPKA